MKNGILAMLICLISFGNMAVCQTVNSKDKECAIRHCDYSYFSPEESWQIQREAYEKQMVSEGLSAKDVDIKMAMFDEIKFALVGQVNQKIKEASLLHDQSEMLMRRAEIKIMDAQILKKKVELLKFDSMGSTKEMSKLQEQVDVLMKQAEQSLQESKDLKKKSDFLMDKADRQKKTGAVFMNDMEIFYQEVVLLSSENSKKRSLKVEVDNKKTVVFRVDGSIVSGDCLIEIFDPNNKKEGEVLLHCVAREKGSTAKVKDCSDKEASGSFVKTIQYPIVGTWSIKLTPKKSKGWVNIKVEDKRD